MDNFNERGFYPEEDWQSLSTPVVKEDTSDDNCDSVPAGPQKINKHSKHPVLTVQLTFAICVLLFLFVLKFMGAPVFDTIISWYKSEISESVIYNGDFESFDFSSLFSTADEG